MGQTSSIPPILRTLSSVLFIYLNFKIHTNTGEYIRMERIGIQRAHIPNPYCFILRVLHFTPNAILF
jgi:hypothetical protein